MYLKKTMKVYKALILFWTMFIGAGAVVGSMMFFLDPQEGFWMGNILPIMQEKLPFSEILFSNFIFSGISLLVVNGISNLTAFVLILKNKKIGYILGFIFGITLILWISIQFYVFYPELPLLDVLFFIFGFLQFICGLLAYVNYCQLEFYESDPFKEKEDLGKKRKITDEKKLVVYFSRMGYTRKKAYEKANELNCKIIEIKAKERISGILGFWWCGRFGMHKWNMTIEDIDIDFSKYEDIYLFSPVWVFSIAAPVRTFISTFKENLNNVNMTIVHFIARPLHSVFKDVRNILSDRLVSIDEYSSHFGKIKHIK